LAESEVCGLCGRLNKKEQDDASASDGGVCSSLAPLPACAVRQVEETPPTVTYAYSDEADYDDIEARADLYCEERYDDQPDRPIRVPEQQHPASEVTAPPSNAATTRRTSKPSNSNCSVVHSVDIGPHLRIW
jgi:hypothetical protein